jgi:hypothetical protein
VTRAWKLCDQAEHEKQLDVALRAIGQVRGCLELRARLSGELKTQATTVNIAIAMKGLSPDEIKEMLREAGHGSWMKIESFSPEENEKRIAELMAKGGYLDGVSKPN